MCIRDSFKSGDFQLLNKRNINIYNLINKFNSNNKYKIKIKFLNSKNIMKSKPRTKTLKSLPGWYGEQDIEKKILATFTK